MVNLKKGFTLIELLVVIAIIGILSSVVLASLNTARGKGADAATKSNLNNIRAQAEIVYDDGSGSYAGVCANANVIKGITAAATAQGLVWTAPGSNSATTGTCTNSAGAWMAAMPLPKGAGAGTYWCVDSTGTSKSVTGTLVPAATVCP